MPVIIHTISIISTPILPLVLLWHSTWWSLSLLPYVYAQINGYCHYYYPECYIETHTSTYGTHGRFLETYTVWKKLAVLDFVALGILSTTWWFLHLAPPVTQNFFQTQNDPPPVRTVCSALDCLTVSTVCIVPSSSWSQSTSVGVYTLGSSLWPVLVSLWMGVSLCEYLILSLLCVCVYVYVSGRRRRLVKAIHTRIPPRSEPR